MGRSKLFARKLPDSLDPASLLSSSSSINATKLANFSATVVADCLEVVGVLRARLSG